MIGPCPGGMTGPCPRGGGGTEGPVGEAPDPVGKIPPTAAHMVEIVAGGCGCPCLTPALFKRGQSPLARRRTRWCPPLRCDPGHIQNFGRDNAEVLNARPRRTAPGCAAQASPRRPSCSRAPQGRMRPDETMKALHLLPRKSLPSQPPLSQRSAHLSVVPAGKAAVSRGARRTAARDHPRADP